MCYLDTLLRTTYQGDRQLGVIEFKLLASY